MITRQPLNERDTRSFALDTDQGTLTLTVDGQETVFPLQETYLIARLLRRHAYEIDNAWYAAEYARIRAERTQP